MASTSSATSKSIRKIYDVFLSFRGEDVRKTFLGHLNDHLKLKGIETFKDNEKLRGGETIGPVLLQAIEESRFAIVIFSKDYASSTWCLDEVAKIMDCKEKFDLVVLPIFYDVEPSNVRKQTGSFAESFAKHKERFKDDEAKVNGWRKALTDAANIKGHDLKAEYDGYELNCIKRVVDDIFKQLRPAPSIPKGLVGLESPLEEICLKMSFENVKFLGIWGMGGLGKTTLANVAFDRLRSGFKHSCFLADIRKKHSEHGMESLQATLLKDVLNVDKMKIPNVYLGTKEIEKRLKPLTVLIVLDDVESLEQLENLVGDGEWLSNGSRIIITTRDKHLFTHFKVTIPHYEVEKLNIEKALELFSWHAFKKESPEKGFEDLSMSFVTYADGLPLALKLWGNALCERKEEKQWKSALEKIKSISNDNFKVRSQLEISVDGLDGKVKETFLDIACFFRHKRRDYIEDALKSCDRNPGIEIPMLIERCLIFESSEYGDKYINMHDLIQEMGWHIASQEKRRSRIWQLEDVDDVLSRKMKSQHIEGILFSPEKNIEDILLPSTEECHTDENVRRAFEAFKHVENLKILIVDVNVKISLDVANYLPSRELRWLDFKNYGFTSLRITKNFHKLTYLDLSQSILEESPNFDKMPNLERLNFSHCSKLKEIHSSIGNLRKLVLLNLRGCTVLEELPSFNQVLSLKFLDLRYCENLKFFPQIKTSLPHLVELDLEEVEIKELPSSIQQLYGLTKLCLTRCKNLVCLSNDLCKLKKLKVVKITCCSKIELLPENLDGLISLKYLNLQRSGFVSLPKSFSILRNLQYLDITSCRNLEKLPKLPKSMKELYVDCHFGFGSNIFELAIKCSEYSIAFYCEDQFEVGTSLAMKFIPFPLHRKNPFCFSYPIPKADILRSFKYRCYGVHNGISITLGNSWYSKNFWGFAICFRPLTGWEPHSYQDIDSRMEHCVIKAKLSHKDDKDKFLQKECVIVGSKASGFYIDGHMCIVNIPFSSLWVEPITTMEGVTRPNDYSRFEVAFKKLEASAYYWGCSFLYHERKKKKKKKCISISRVSHETLKKEVIREINSLQVLKNVCTLVPKIGSITCIESITCITLIQIEDYTNFMWTNLPSWDVNLQGGTTKIGHLSECISRLHHYHYLDCNNGFRRCEKNHQLPANIRELYACHTLASESKIAELASKYSELYSVSFSDGVVTLSTAELAKKFSELLLNRNTPFTFTYTITERWQANSNMRWFKYSSRASNKISIDLDPTWYNQNFLGFVVCFLFSGREIWESNADIRPFRHCEIIAKLAHKDNGNKVLLKKCMIGRLYNEEFDFTFGDRGLVCFAYIPFSSMWKESKNIMDNVTPNHYSIFEVTFLDLEVSTDWSCDLLYTTEAIRRKWEQEHTDSGTSDSGLDKTKLWQLTKIVHLAQSKMEFNQSMPECYNTKVVQLLYTNFGVGILALSSNGILKLWKCSHDNQNPSEKHWQPNSGSSMTDNEEAIPCMALSKDDSYVVSTSGEHVSLFSIMEFEVMKTFTWLQSPTTFLAFHPHDNYTIAIGTENSTIYIWDVRTDEAKSLEGHLKCITGLAFSTNCNILVSSGADARLCAWSIDTWQETISVPIRLHGDEVDADDKQPTQVMFHADQVHLLVTHETQLAIYDASNKMECIRRWIPHGSLSAPISSATYSCNSQLVYASFKDGNIGVLDADTLRPRCHIAPSAYLSQVISNRSEAAFPVVIAAHPEEPIQFAVGLTDGSVKVIQLLKSQVEWEVPSPQNNEILNVEDNGHGFGKVIFDDDDVSSDEEFHIIERLPKYSGEPKFLPYGLMASTSSQTSSSHPPADGNRLIAIASQSTQRWTYDVFLSFRGLDTCKTFIDDLYGYLECKGIRTFKDEDRLEKEDCISPSLLKAIQESKFLIAVFSEGYASSKWCLDELATIMDHQEKLKDQIVVPIFYYVEPSDVRNQNGSFGDSFKELVEKIGKDDEEKVRRWKEALKKAGNLKGHHMQNDYNGYEATCAENVAADIHSRLNQALLAFEKNLVGLESRVNNIINWLRLASDADDDADAQFIGICGMGGIGKTTIAMVVFNRFSHQFDGACFLADVRQHNVIELQKTLLTEVLKEKEKSGVQICNVHDGQEKIRMRLKEKKVLIVLDDVDDQLKQLDTLAGGRDWFGRGSRVIITARDAGVLRSHGADQKYIYQVDTLKEQEAIQLFSWYAFKTKIPKTGFEELCGSIVRYAMGLPLCLKVLGSHLCGKKAVNWETILKKLKDANSLHTPQDKILNVLRISFDGLDPENKNAFLDITCFFRDWREEYVKGVLDSDLCELIEKSLISVQNGRIEMHDRIQEMGRYIASQEKPWRLWQLKDAVNVLSGKMNHKDIEGISLFGEVSGWGDGPVEISFREMINLKMFKVDGHGNRFHVTDNDLPSSLRWLEIQFYRFASLPESFASSELVGLSLRNSSLQNWRITKKLDKLTLLDLSWSESLLETPDFDWMPNLRRLNLQYCKDLRVVHPSIGNLNKLVLLDLSGCSNLESLPSFNQVSSLNSFGLCGCIELKKFPEIKARTPHLVELDLVNVGIIELPSSIKQLHGLTKLGLYDCEYLECLCDGLCDLKNLKVLVINHCTNLKSLSENLNQLPCLQCLDIRYCSKLKVLPKLPKTIRQLYADPSFAFRGNIADLAKNCSELHSLAFSVDEERWPGHFLAKMCIRIPFQRKTPFSVSFPVISEKDPITSVNALRFFQYRCYDSNGISISFRYCKSFVGFAVYFFSSEYDIWEPQFGQDIGDTHCTVIAKLSDKDDGNEVFQRKCVIAKPDCEDYNGIKENMCFLYIPFSSLWPAESNTNINSVSPNDFSRFEVNFMNLEATADWGCSLLYKRKKRPFSWDGSRQGCGTDIGPLGMLKYLNLSGKEFKHFLPEDISRFRRLQYLDISGCRGIIKLPELPATIRELYADTYLALESNIAELAAKYSKLYSVSFSEPIYIDLYPDPLVPGELAKKFIPITQPFLNRNTPFAVTYPFYTTGQTDHYYLSRCFKYSHHDSSHHDPHKISVSLDPTWYSHNFVGFVVCFVFPWLVKWESCPDIHPFRSCKLITKLIHKDNGREPPLETECVIGRLNDEEFDDSDDDIVCFVYIPFSSLWPKSKAITDNITPNHYLIFEATIQDLEFSTHWSCGLLCTNNESLTQVIRQEREVGSSYKKSGFSKSDSEEVKDEDEEETEEEEVDSGSEYIEDSGGDDAMTEDSDGDDAMAEDSGGDDAMTEDSDGDDAIAEDSGGDDAMAEDIKPEETYGLMASSSAATASPSTEGWTYDVFLSFRGPDVHNTFIDFLYNSLECKGIRTFKDDETLAKGDCIPPSLLKSIQESQFLIAVFSKGYASSKWCLEELATMMECHVKFKKQILLPIFHYVEPSDVRKQEGSFGDSFNELLKRCVKDEEEKVRRWKEALKKAGYLKGYHLQKDYKGYEATCAEKVAADIHARLNQALVAFEENLVGLESRVNNIGNWLRLASDDNDDDVRFIGICGMGGIGKTTIAMVVFNRFLHQFDGACFLANVRQHNIIELQKTLLTEVLKEKSRVQISSVQDGKAKIRAWLRGKKVLIVLDDVDNQLEQLDELAGGQDWFGRGSRVIITTRDAGVLFSHGEMYIYQVDTLEEQEAFQLFSWYAFKKKIPMPGFEALCGSIVRHAMSLPLALKVLGSSLCGLEAADWENTLEELKGTPNNDIDTKLKICFDRLDSNTKNIFLHIACFFRHEKEEYVKNVLKRCDLQPVIGMRILIQRSLISVLEGRIEMHDLIQEMGWHIASLDRPRCRVWQLKDVDDVLSGKMDPKHKEGILLPSAGDINEENICELKWLDFKFYPFTSLPESFRPSKLVWFSLHHSYLVNCRINQKLDKLIYLDLSSSYSLSETPDFDWMPNLMRLNLSDCQKLKEIHPSIGNLRKLILLDLSKCHDLERLPSFNQVSSLRSFNLLGCIGLKNFPEIKTRTPHLVELDLKMAGIKEVSSSIQNLHGLTRLCLDQCPHLVRLCNGLCELKSLKVLEIKNCRNLKTLPENLEGLISLEYLNFQGCCFDSLPESFSQLTCLQYLSITDCEIPKELPKLPANIKELYADCGFKIAELAIQYSKLNLVSFSTGDQHGVVTSLAKKFIHFPLHRKTPFSASYRINSVDLEKSKMLRTFKYRHYKSNGICINLDSSWYSKIFMGFVVCFFEKKGNIWGRHSYQAIDNSIRSCTVIVKLSHKDNKDEVLQIDCVIAVSSFDNFDDIYGTLCCAYIPVRSLWGESKAIKDYSRFEVQFMNFKSSADWGCSLLYERQIGATKHKGYHGGTDSGLTTDDIGCLSSLGLGMEYLNLNRRDLACLPKLTYLQYLDISGCRRLIMLPTLPPTIKELYAHSNLASESNIAKLAITYPELYSVSFSHGYATVSAEELARKFVRVPFQIRNSPFVVTYPACDDLADIDTKRWFKYTSHCSNEISINLKSSWYNEIFMGFVVCFLLQGRPQRWESHPDILPFRHCKIIAKLIHKDNANEVLQTDCVIGRLYDEEFDDEFQDCQFICFAYIPSSGLLSKYEGDPNDYSVFEVAFPDSSNSSDWSCGLLYEDDELLSEAIRSNIYTDTLKSQQELGNEGEDEDMGDEEDGHEWKQRKKARLDKGPHITKSSQLTEIVSPDQCQMVSMPECFDAKVVRLLYTKSGVGIMALSLDGILKLWKWPHNKQNPSAKATVNFVPQYWQTNSGLLIDVSGANTMELFPCIALSNDGYFVALAFGEKVSLFSMNTFGFQEMTTFKLPSASTCLAHDPCAYEIIAIGTKDSTIYLYNFAKEKVITKLKGHQNCITGLAFSTNPYMLVSSGADAQLCKWNILGRWKKRISVRIELPAGEVFSGDTQVMFHVDQLHLLVTHKTQLAIYDASKMERISQWIPRGSLSTPISSATYSSNSLLVYASFNDGNIGVFDAHSLRLRCCIAPSAYLSQIVPDRIKGVYPVAIAADPQKTNQFAIGLTNGSVKVIEPRESERKWGVSLAIDNEEEQNEDEDKEEEEDGGLEHIEDSSGDDAMTEDSNTEDEDEDEEGEEDGRSQHTEDSGGDDAMVEDSNPGTAMAKHRAEMQTNEGRGIRFTSSGGNTCIGSPPTKKRTRGSSSTCLSQNLAKLCISNPTNSGSGKEGEDDEMGESFDGDEDGAGHGVEVAMSKYNDSVNEKEKERENEQRKKPRLNDDKTPSSSKQNRKIRDQSDELSPTGTQPPIVGDDVLQQMWDNFNCLLASFPLDEEYIKLEIDQTIFHHTDTCSTFMLINDIKDMMKMDFIDASIIKLFILFLNRLCNQFQVTSIGFVCPVRISMNEVKQNVPDITDITTYLTHVMEQHKNKQFILAPYLQKFHWLLLVICIRSKSIYVLDPLPHNRTIGIKNSLNRALHSVSTNERNINWKQCKCPIQPGGVECGYYVMRYMFDIVTKYSSFECLDEAFESNNQYSINEINEIRALWAKSFLEECM